MGVLSLDLQQTDAGEGYEEDIRRLEHAIESEENARISGDSELSTALGNERTARQGADAEIWQEINTLEAASDVVDVVGTYADLQNYDTSKLHANDLIKVLRDSTHNDAITYYRWSGSAFNYVGAEGPYYTTAETDTLLNAKQDKIIAGNNIQIAADGKTISATDTTYSAGTNVQISAGNVISATDTKYSAGVGLLLEGSEFAVDTSVVAELSDIPSQTSDLVNNGSDGLSTYVEADELATVATSGSYNDLTNKPTIPAAQIQSDWTQSDTSAVDYIKNKPTIPAPYVLPPATTSDLGGIIVGTNLSVDSDGVLSAVDTTYTAGNNVQINNNVISATNTTYGVFDDDTDGLTPGPTSAEISAGKFLKADGTWDIPATASYTAGNGISIDANNEISADTTVLATQTDLSGKQDTLTAGGNIQINNNVISATDTTYSTFTTDLNGLVPGPSAAEVSAGNKFLKADGSWATVQASSIVTLYSNSSLGSSTSIYDDSSLTTAVEGRDIKTAMGAGTVIIHDTDGNDYVVVSGDITSGALYQAVHDNKLYKISYEWDDDTIMSVAVTNVQPRLTAGSNISISGNTISATDTTYSNFVGTDGEDDGAAGLVPAPMIGQFQGVLKATGTWGKVDYSEVLNTPTNFTGATSSTAGTSGLVPAPAAGAQEKVLHGDGTWKDTTAKLVEMSYGESNAWAKFIAAYNAGSIVYCRASSNADPASGSQTRKAFMAYVNNETNPTSVEFQYVRSVSSKTDSQQGDQVFVYTLKNTSGGQWSVASRNMSPKINVSAPITKTFSNGANATVTIGANAMTGATSSAAGAAGIVPKPNSGDEDKVLTGAGTWSNITGSNVDFSSAAGTAVIKTITDSLGRTGIYFADGTLITTRKAQYVGPISTAWGSLYEGHTNDYYKFAPTGGDDFIAEPDVQVTLFNSATSGSCWLGAWENSPQIVSGGWAIPAGALCFLRPTSWAGNITLNMYIQAIGKWK